MQLQQWKQGRGVPLGSEIQGQEGRRGRALRPNKAFVFLSAASMGSHRRVQVRGMLFSDTCADGIFLASGWGDGLWLAKRAAGRLVKGWAVLPRGGGSAWARMERRCKDAYNLPGLGVLFLEHLPKMPCPLGKHLLRAPRTVTPIDPVIPTYRNLS